MGGREDAGPVVPTASLDLHLQIEGRVIALLLAFPALINVFSGRKSPLAPSFPRWPVPRTLGRKEFSYTPTQLTSPRTHTSQACPATGLCTDM